MAKYKYLTDANFLLEIDNLKIETYLIKIILLDWKENPIREIEGISSSGSLNLDGNSSIRRNASLTMILDETEIEDIPYISNLFSINKKAKVEIGIKNSTQKYNEYDIIWFPQGTFIINNPVFNNNLDNFSLSLTLKDKMCLLNGECGGVIPAATQFDEYEIIDENGKYVIQRPIISQIIRELVNHFGGEDLSKIIISDIDNRIKQVMRWTGNYPVYRYKNGGSYYLTPRLEDVVGKEYFTYTFGDDIGYIYTDFTFPGELIGNAGDSVCTILDKIKSVLGNFEYFYDEEGFFHFQEIKNYLNNSQAKIEIDNMKQENYLIDISKGKTEYDFTNRNLITSFSNTPHYDLIKNDFVVWGLRKNANGTSVPIRYHLAIDNKPKINNEYKVFFYDDPEDKLIKAKTCINFKNFDSLSKHNGTIGLFYITIDNNKIYKWNGKEYEEINVPITDIITDDWRSELYLQGSASEPLAIKSNYYYTELLNEWPKLYDIQNKKFYDEVINNSSNIDFFLDFIDTNSSLAELNVNNIGRRSIVINDDKINCIFEPNIPDFILIELGTEETESQRKECELKNQPYIQIDSSIYKMISTGGQHNSAYNKVRELLYQHTRYNESITLQSLPIYHLQPNVRIKVKDTESHINGEYMISNISIPLGEQNNMTINATKVLERI